jgi:hypothetical protein
MDLKDYAIEIGAVVLALIALGTLVQLSEKIQTKLESSEKESYRSWGHRLEKGMPYALMAVFWVGILYFGDFSWSRERASSPWSYGPLIGVIAVGAIVNLRKRVRGLEYRIDSLTRSHEDRTQDLEDRIEDLESSTRSDGLV